MLASCSPGLTVVNIDNGYGAAMAALRILRSAATSAALA
jgi:NCAIR mutase (PurE)-related protein